MKMRVHEQILPPGMKDRQKTNIDTKVFGIRCNPTECFRSSAKKNIVYDFLVLPCDRTYAVRDSEDNVEISNL